MPGHLPSALQEHGYRREPVRSPGTDALDILWENHAPGLSVERRSRAHWKTAERWWFAFRSVSQEDEARARAPNRPPLRREALKLGNQAPALRHQRHRGAFACMALDGRAEPFRTGISLHQSTNSQERYREDPPPGMMSPSTSPSCSLVRISTAVTPSRRFRLAACSLNEPYAYKEAITRQSCPTTDKEAKERVVVEECVTTSEYSLKFWAIKFRNLRLKLKMITGRRALV